MSESEFEAWTFKLYQKAARLGLSADGIKIYTMTKLEEEIARALPFAHSFDYAKGATDFHEVPDEYLAQVAKAAAEVAKRYIEKAYIEGYYALANTDSEEWPHPEKITGQVLADKWLKENGITK